MPIQTLGFLPHMNDFRRTLPDQIFRFLHGKSVVAADDEDIGGRAFVARCASPRGAPREAPVWRFMVHSVPERKSSSIWARDAVPVFAAKRLASEPQR
jgi:hypothetical protein